MFWTIGLIFIFLASCSGPQRHADLREDLTVMVRQFTLSTHGPLDIGERGTEYSNPVIFNDNVIFGNRTTGLVSFYPRLRRIYWNLPIRGGIVSELALDQNRIFFGGGDGFLYCVDALHGRVLWKYDLRNPYISKPFLLNGRVFLTTSDDVVYCLDAGTGKWLWHYRRRSQKITKILMPCEPLVDGQDVLVGLSDGFLVALSLEEGQLKWEKMIHSGPHFTDVNAHPVLDRGILYVPSYDGALYALKRDQAEVLWKFDAGGSKQVLIEEGMLYLPSSDGTIYALQKNYAKLIWKFELDQGTPTQLVVTSDYLIVGSSYQYLYVIDKKTGRGVYRFHVGHGSGFAGSPAFDSLRNQLYILSSAGHLYSFLMRKPFKKPWLYRISDPFYF